MATKNLMIRCVADFSGLTKATESAKKGVASLKRSADSAGISVKNCGNKATKAFSGLKKAAVFTAIAVAAKRTASALKKLTTEAIGVDSQVDNLSRTMSTGKSAFLAWAKTGAAAFGISESAAIKYGNAYSNLISGFIGDTQKSTEYTKKLIETSAVIASRTGRTVKDVNDRIRSGLLGSTEAIEDLGINVNVALLETTDAFKQLANGRSWSKLTFQEQQQVRLFAIMEQSSKKFGDQLSGGGSSSLLMFNAQLENMKLNIGRAFAPIVNVAIPALTNFIAKLSEGVAKIGEFFSALLGTKSASTGVGAVAESASSAASAMGDASTAAKELKNATIGIDELNVVSADASSNTAQTAGSETGVSALPDAEETTAGANGLSGKLDELSKKVRGFGEELKKAFSPSSSAWEKAFGKLESPVKTAMKNISTALSGLWTETLSPLAGYVTTDFIPTISNAFSNTFAPIFSGVAATALKVFGEDFSFACEQVDQITKDVLLPSLDFLGLCAVDIFAGIGSAWDEHGAGILAKFEEFKESLRGIWESVYSSVIKPVFDYIGGTVTWLWNDHLKPLWDKLTDFFGSLSECLLTLWNKVISPLVTFIVERVGPPISFVFGQISAVIGTLVSVVSDVVGGILQYFSGLMDFITGVFTGDWNKAWEGIKKSFEGLWNEVWGVVKGVINLIIDGINTLWGGIYSAIKGLVDGVGSIAGVIGDLLGQDWHFEMPKEPPLIPKLASGGLAYGPTLAMIGEGADREAVLPLNSGVYAELAKGINGASNGDNTPFLRSIDSRLARLLEWAEQLDLNIRLFVGDREIYNAAERGRKGSGAVIVRV